MGERTILEVRVPNQSVDQVRQFLGGWLPGQKFTIDEWQSTGEPKVIWRKTIRVKITPVPGAIVATHIGMGGAIVFDILLRQEGPNVMFQIQGYAATAGITAGGEMSLSPNPGMNARVPRKKGYEVMMRLFNDMGAMSGVPLQPAPPGAPMQAPQPQQPYPQQPQQQPYTQQPYPPQPQQPYPPQPQQQPYPPQQPQQQPYPPQQPQQQPPPQQPQQQPPPQQPQPQQSQVRPAAGGFCMHCGSPLQPGAAFCASCGKPRE